MFERTAPEQFDTLPDIPEPAENPHLAGHGDAASMLAGAYRAGRLHHALLLAGPPGIGKATLAFHLAHHLLANPEPEAAPEQLSVPDPASQTFRLIAQDAHPSLLHLSRPFSERDKKFKTAITVDEIRRVSRFLSLTAHDGSYRVVIVDPADDMNNSAANALLKSLEEPPSKTIFVLITHSPGRLLPTIRSRCQTVRLQPLAAEPLLALLARLGATLPEDEAARRLLAERADGSVRNAILLTEYGGLEIAETVDRIVQAGGAFDIAGAQRLGDALSGRDAQVQFSIFNRQVLERAAAMASRTAETGNVRTAERLAALWEDLSAAIRDAEIYNLDRRQHVIGTLGRLRAAMHALPQRM